MTPFPSKGLARGEWHSVPRALTPSSSAPGGPDLEAGIDEMAVEREGPLEPAPPHQDERNAVGEADLLVGELREDLHGLCLVARIRTQDSQAAGGKQRSGALGGKAVRSSSAEQGKRLVEHEVAREAGEILPLDLGPIPRSALVLIVVTHEARDERPRVDEDHSWSS